VQYITDRIGEYAELGFDEVIIPDFALGASREDRFANYELFTAEIVPALT